MPKKTKPLPCPCCGNEEIYTGAMSATSQGVQCLAEKKPCCYLSISRDVRFVKIPSKIKGIPGIDAYLLEQAILAWNKRTESKS